MVYEWFIKKALRNDIQGTRLPSREGEAGREEKDWASGRGGLDSL